MEARLLAWLVTAAAACALLLQQVPVAAADEHRDADHPSRRGSAVFNVRHYGAVGDNTTHDTIAVRAAAAALRKAGGGTMLFPSAGNFLTGPFNISSHSIVVIEAGATVTGSPRGEDYPLVDPIAMYGWGSMPHPLIYATGATNVTLTGGGTVSCGR
jgi:polygalacturonase